MILIAAVVVWLLCLLWVTLTPRLALEARRFVQLELAAFGALGILTAGFFWQLLFTPNAYMPAGGGDLAGFLYPTYRFAQTWLSRGVIPLWNPYIFGGTLFLADIQTALFYPPNLLTYVLSNPLQYRDLEYLSVLHFYLAGAGMYALLRYGRLVENRALNRFASLGGALAFAFSDLFITHFGNLNLIASAAWLPLVFLFFTRALDAEPDSLGGTVRGLVRSKPALHFSLLAGVTLAGAFFAGHVQPFLFILLVLVLDAGYVLARNRARVKQVGLVSLITFAVGVGLSAITLLPAFELTALSVRSGFTYQDAAQFSLPPIELVGMFVPAFFGRGPADAWGPWSRVEVGYLGIFPLLLALCAVILRRRARTWFFVLLVVVGLMLSLGGYAILHGWLFQFAPGFGQLRAPARFVFVMDFGLAVLAAIGLDALVTPWTEAARQSFLRAVKVGGWVGLLVALTSGALALGILILGQGQDPALFQRIANAAHGIGFFILLLAFSFALLLARARHWLTTRVWSLAALALIFFDLFSLGAYVDIGTSDPTLGYQRADIVEFLQNNAGLARIDSRTDVEGLWRPDTGLLFGLQDVYGDNPLVLQDFDTYWENLRGRDRVGYALLNVKYVLARRGTPLPSNFNQAFVGGGGLVVWENTCALPRAWIVYNAQVVDAWQETLNRVGTQGCSDPNSAVPINVNIHIAGQGARALEHPDFLNTDPFEITRYSPNEISGTANARWDGYVFFGENFVSGWRAYVDDNPAPVVRANYLFRAVPISAGAHRVRLAYEPSSVQSGALITLLTLLGVTAAFGWNFLRKKK